MSQFFVSGGGGFPATVPVTVPEQNPYTIQPGDYAIIIDSTGPWTINLPASPITGQRYIFKDAVGTAGSDPITIDGNGNTIDDQPTYVIQVNWGFAGVLYNGFGWSVTNQ